MNEQRQQAYLNLIERLLNSPSGEEPQILQANRELLDADFLQMLDAEAQMLSQQGNENAANWLRNLAVELGEALGLSSPTDTVAKLSEDDLQAYEQFLMEVLQATAESEGDARGVYPLLVENTGHLNQTLAEVLRHWATTTLPDKPPDQAQFIATVINSFSNRIQEFPLGNKASNMEIAIAGYEIVLTVFTRDAFPQDWAKTQNNLGNAYSYRILGDKAQNLEEAITAYTAALTVYTRDTFPQQWATTQNNLGIAYSDRIMGDKAHNLKQTIASFSAALQVLTREAFPQNHAETLFNLGTAYQDTQRLTEAYMTFHRALETVEFLRGDIVSGDESKRKQAEQWYQLYRRMVEVCLELDNIPEAIEYAERSKTRNLVELILERDLRTIFPLEVVTQLEQLQNEIASAQYQLQNGKAENPTVLTQHLQQLRQQRNDLQNRYLPIGYGFKLGILLIKLTLMLIFYGKI